MRVKAYREDELALATLREAGYGLTEAAILRRLVRERAAQITGPSNDRKVA